MGISYQSCALTDVCLIISFLPPESIQPKMHKQLQSLLHQGNNTYCTEAAHILSQDAAQPDLCQAAPSQQTRSFDLVGITQEGCVVQDKHDTALDSVKPFNLCHMSKYNIPPAPRETCTPHPCYTCAKECATRGTVRTPPHTNFAAARTRDKHKTKKACGHKHEHKATYCLWAPHTSTNV